MSHYCALSSYRPLPIRADIVYVPASHRITSHLRQKKKRKPTNRKPTTPSLLIHTSYTTKKSPKRPSQAVRPQLRKTAATFMAPASTGSKLAPPVTLLFGLPVKFVPAPGGTGITVCTATIAVTVTSSPPVATAKGIVSVTVLSPSFPHASH